MSRFELFVAAWLTRRLVEQGNHKRRIIDLFMMLRRQAEFEFTEDSAESLSAFLLDCFHSANARVEANGLIAKMKEPA